MYQFAYLHCGIQVCACLADVHADSAFWQHLCHCPKLLGSPDELGACFAGFSFTNLDVVWNNCSACPPCDTAQGFFSQILISTPVGCR